MSEKPKYQDEMCTATYFAILAAHCDEMTRDTFLAFAEQAWFLFEENLGKGKEAIEAHFCTALGGCDVRH